MGQLQIPVDDELHRKIKAAAAISGLPMRDWLVAKLKQAVGVDGTPTAKENEHCGRSDCLNELKHTHACENHPKIPGKIRPEALRGHKLCAECLMNEIPIPA